MLSTVASEIQRFIRKHEMRLDHHVITMTIQLLDNFKGIKRLNRLKLYDLGIQIKVGATSIEVQPHKRALYLLIYVSKYNW